MFDFQVETKNGLIKYGFISKQDIKLEEYFYRAREYAEGNRKAAARFIHEKLDDILVSEQVHGNDCHEVDSFADLQGDALATKVKNIPIAVQTADCVPVILYDQNNVIVGIAHAGWRGAFSGVIEKTIQKLISMGASVGEIKAIIGPAIEQKSYEVDKAFYENFIKQNSSNSKFFISGVNPEKFMFDLKGYCHERLKNAGVEDIQRVEIDTYSNTDKFFSYRKQCHLGYNKLDGHILSYIVIL